MFRRRRRVEEPDEDFIAEIAGRDEPADEPAARVGGPWDAADDVPQIPRVDLGGVQIPVGPDLEVQVNVADGQVVAATVVHAHSAMQVQAFAAPKSSGLWDDVRKEIAAELERSGGRAEEAEGAFGPELRAWVPVEMAGQGPMVQPARFIGVNGPRWFLRGVLSGPAAMDAAAAARLEEVFRGIIVVRGDAPMPPRDMIELRLPAEARQALDTAGGEPQEPAPTYQDLNPFVRGPEITEIR